MPFFYRFLFLTFMAVDVLLSKFDHGHGHYLPSGNICQDGTQDVGHCCHPISSHVTSSYFAAWVDVLLQAGIFRHYKNA